MKTDEEYDRTARDGQAFSNSTGYEIWSYNVCQGADNPRERCVNDDNDDCPLLGLAITGRIPAEWTGPHERYACSEKTRPAEARRHAEAAARELLAEQHYPMFPE